MLGSRRVRGWPLGLWLSLALAMLWPARADAYPWMIRHLYSGCSSCHVDPSGGGILTRYGEVIEAAVLPSGASSEAASAPGFLFGAIETPAWLGLDADARALWLRSKAPGARLIDELIWMQADAQASLTLGGFLAAGSLGYAAQGALGAAITRDVEHNLVSRQHWLGYAFESGLVLRAGRLNLPFGLRTLKASTVMAMAFRMPTS